MYNSQTYFPINWVDGMKINKQVFIARDNATTDAICRMANLALSPARFGILASGKNSDDNFNMRASIDNQMTLRVSILSCKAITQGGIAINIPAAGSTSAADGVPAASFLFPETSIHTIYWIVLLANPFRQVPFGTPDPGEDPVRLPFVQPEYKIEIIPEDQYNQFVSHPYALFVGRVMLNGNNAVIDEDYIPPSYAVCAHPALIDLYGELDSFLSATENYCSRIVQKIYKKNQQNELSELVLFLCDRVMLFLSESITNTRWLYYYESPVQLLSAIATLARIIKNTIGLRTGTGKDELLNYLSEWSGLKPGELENIFTHVAVLRYDNNDIHKCIKAVAGFVSVAGKLFETLSNLEFIGKKKDSGFFIKEEQSIDLTDNKEQPTPKVRRRFFG